ncbi:MAG: hypothetical protein VX627_01700 [Candidatus Thermoplasmatota archaeon]|nr:hypothetical protein [Candidatus Thermoplasmatota archaeon]
MRHLSVPSHETERILQMLSAANALPDGARVQPHPDDDNRRLIPVIDDFESEYPSMNMEANFPSSRTYREHLVDLLPPSTISSIEWPTRHEFIGDLILIKLDDSQRPYGHEIGKALLLQHSRIRAVYEDRGVIGQFRVRELELLAVRENSTPGTRTNIIESGQRLWTDPAKVYYSSRLSHEREGTLACAQKLRSTLGRPIDVCDPYAGVGPSLKPLISEDGLVRNLFGGDLNPAAIELLEENIEHPSAQLECADALTLSKRNEMVNSWDLLLVNIPHNSLSHLPHLLPLLRTTGVVRGWAVVDESEFQQSELLLQEILGMDVELEIRRSYSANSNLCRFEAWINGAPAGI